MCSPWLYNFSSEKDTGKIHIYDGRGSNVPLHTINIHTKPITFIKVLLLLFMCFCVNVSRVYCVTYCILYKKMGYTFPLPKQQS